MSESSSTVDAWTAKFASFSNAECLMFVEKLYRCQQCKLSKIDITISYSSIVDNHHPP